MFRSAVAVLVTSLVLTGCQSNVSTTDKAGEDGTAALAVGSGTPAPGPGESAATTGSSANAAAAPAQAFGATGSAPTTNATGQPAATGVSADTPARPVPSVAAGQAAASAAPGSRAEAPAKAAASNLNASGPAAATATDPAPRVAPPEPTFKLVTVPAGTTLNVTLTNAVGSDTSNVEDSVRGKIASDVVIDGLTAIPAGSDISGSVTDAQRSGRVKGRATVAFRFDRLEVRDETSRIHTSSVAREAEADRGDDLKKGGIGAGIGAIVGGVAGGKKGAAIGAGVGGAGTVMATRGKEVRLPAGSRVRVTLRDALEVRVPVG